MSGIDGWPEKRTARDRFVRGEMLGAFAAPGLFAGTVSVRSAPDALHRRVRAELKVFTDGLRRNGDNPGTCARPYAEEVANARARGF